MDALSRPIFIVAPPQSGSKYLYHALGRAPGIRTLDGEQRDLIDLAEELDPAVRDYDSNRRTAADAPPEAVERLRARLLRSLADADADDPSALIADPPPRLLDAAPRDALRVPFLAAVFPDASFVYVYREPRHTLAGMLAAWESGSFVTYPSLPGWPGPEWSMLLIPGWRELAARPLAEIVGEQWLATTRTLLDDLDALSPDRWCVTDFAALVADPARELERLCDHLGVEYVDEVASGHPRAHVLTPNRETQEANSEDLQATLARTTGLAERAHDLIAAPVSRRPRPTPDMDSPLRSVYTAGFLRILERRGCSLLISTYGAGRLICARHDGTRLNTHFRRVRRPTGIAASGQRLAIGAEAEIWDYRNSDEAAARSAEPAGRLDGSRAYDACYLPRNRHYTGDVGVHELAFAANELWLVATRFDCLATLDLEHSFIPRWKPPFVTAADGEDRCHLSGLAVIDDEPAYVTALGETDAPDGWRAGRRDGGCVVDVRESRTVATGLCLPHSPRWHRDRLWLLESGRGALCTLDPAGGEVETVATVPGFARGLAFADRLAFIGVSRLRETEEGEALPIAERLEEPACGVWVVDIEHGEAVGFLRFEEQVDEVFEVALLPWHRFPEIAGEDGETTRESFVLG